MTTRSAQTRSAQTRSARTLARHLRLVVLTGGIVLGASACELSLGAESRPAGAPAAEASTVGTADTTVPPAAGVDPTTGSAPAATGLPADADRGGAVLPSGASFPGPASTEAPVPPSTELPPTPPAVTLPPTTAPRTSPATTQPTQPTTTAPTTTAPTTTAPTTTAPTTTAPTTTAPTTTAPTTTAPTTTVQPPVTLPPYTVPPQAITTYRVDITPVTIALAADCLPAGRSSLYIQAERYVTGHTFEPFGLSVGTAPVAFGTPISMTTQNLGQGYAGFMTWTVEGFQQRETDFAIGGVGATQVRDHRSITSADGTRSCRADVVYTVTVTPI